MKVFSEDLLRINYYALDKKSCISEMVDFLAENGILTDSEKFLDEVMERESLMSTGIGRNVAIPHARSSFVSKLQIAVYLLDNELEFDSIDGEPVKVVFMIAVPLNMKTEYMAVLSMISNFCQNDDNRQKLLSCKTVEEMYELLKGIEDEV